MTHWSTYLGRRGNIVLWVEGARHEFEPANALQLALALSEVAAPALRPPPPSRLLDFANPAERPENDVNLG